MDDVEAWIVWHKHFYLCEGRTLSHLNMVTYERNTITSIIIDLILLTLKFQLFLRGPACCHGNGYSACTNSSAAAEGTGIYANIMISETKPQFIITLFV